MISVKKDENVLLDSYIKNFLNPRYVFLPIEDGYKLKVKDNTYVYKNDIIMISSNKPSIHSPISGKVLGIKDMEYFKKGKRTSLVIENDFKENIRIKKSVKKYIKNYTRDNFMNILIDTSLTHKNKYIYEKFITPPKNMIINGIETDPYFGNKYFTIIEHIEEVLETADLISNIYSIDNIILAIRNTESEIVDKIYNLIGTYPNITLRLFNDGYALGINEYLSEVIGLKESLVLEVDELYDIYNVLKREVPVTEKLITISGEGVTPKKVLRVKRGTLLSEAFITNFDFTYKSVDVYINGMMMGNLVNSLKYVIDDDIEGLIILEKEDKQETLCINCGLCHKNCPKDLYPKYVYDHKGRVKEDYRAGCLGCGLCNYVCPANRDLKKYMKG